MADELDETVIKEKEKWSQSISSVIIGIVFILVGLPLWWNTTKVYRASLPYENIEMLKNQKITYKVHIAIVVPREETLSQADIIKTELLKRLTNERDSAVKPTYEVNVRLLTEKENLIITNAIKERKTVQELDLEFQENTGSPYDVYSFVLLTPELLGENVYIGKHLHSFMPYSKGDDFKTDKVLDIIRDIYVNTNMLNNAIDTATKRTIQKDSLENIRAQKSVSGYQISFSLLNADPHSVLPQWDIKQVITKYLDPFLQRLDFLDTSIDSQVIHYSSLEIKPKKKDGVFYLKYQNLPHLINPIEAKLGSHVSLNSNLNFIVYVPSQSHTPLYIKDKNGKVAESNAFLSPQWGGFAIYNINDTKARMIDMCKVMKVFISQLKLLLGATSVMAPQNCVLGEYSSSGITRWEQVSLLRSKSIEYIASSTSTLTSLARLLEQISNMVIGDEIQKQVEQALHSIHKSNKYLQEGKIQDAFFQAKEALKSSEKAFFDPSILALLYFPDDQKYAIYIPLFLPISIPVLVTMVKGLRWLKKGDQNKHLLDTKKK